MAWIKKKIQNHHKKTSDVCNTIMLRNTKYNKRNLIKLCQVSIFPWASPPQEEACIYSTNWKEPRNFSLCPPTTFPLCDTSHMFVSHHAALAVWLVIPVYGDRVHHWDAITHFTFMTIHFLLKICLRLVCCLFLSITFGTLKIYILQKDTKKNVKKSIKWLEELPF